MKRNQLILFLIMMLPMMVSGHQNDPVLVGHISYMNSQSVYVRFDNKLNIQPGDTLYLQTEGKLMPALIVSNLSSLSCVCKPISDVRLKPEDQLHALIKETTVNVNDIISEKKEKEVNYG